MRAYSRLQASSMKLSLKRALTAVSLQVSPSTCILSCRLSLPFLKDGIVQQACSDDFLIVLCLEFCKVQSHQLISRLRCLDQAEQDQRLGFLAYEIKRLLQHPELFPSESSRVRFLTFLAADSRFQSCKAISSLLMQNEIHNIQESWRKNVSRRGYVEGTRGWENFLLLDAPGLPFTSDKTMPKSIVQVMPPVASRIVADFEREEREILRFVEQVRRLSSCFVSGHGDSADITTEQSSSGPASANDNHDRFCECLFPWKNDLHLSDIFQDNPTENSDRVPDVGLPQQVKQVRVLLCVTFTVELTLLRQCFAPIHSRR